MTLIDCPMISENNLEGYKPYPLGEHLPSSLYLTLLIHPQKIKSYKIQIKDLQLNNRDCKSRLAGGINPLLNRQLRQLRCLRHLRCLHFYLIRSILYCEKCIQTSINQTDGKLKKIKVSISRYLNLLVN